MRISDWSSDVCSSDLFRPFSGDEFSECQVCLCEPRLVRLKRPRHSPRRLLVDGNACCGIKAGDLLLTALPIDDRRGLALQAARRVLLGNPFEGCHAFRPGDWIDDRHRRAAADVCKTEMILPEVA